MGRPPRYTDEAILDSAARLVVDGGAAALTVVGVAKSLGAPSGSVYHRFTSRDHLAAALWLRTVERFDAEVVARLGDPGDPVEVAVGVACATVDWAATHPVDAFVLTMFRRTDLTGDDAPPDLAERAREIGVLQRASVAQLAERLGVESDQAWFAVAGIALAAVRGQVGSRRGVPGWVRDTVERAVRAALEPAS